MCSNPSNPYDNFDKYSEFEVKKVEGKYYFVNKDIKN